MSIYEVFFCQSDNNGAVPIYLRLAAASQVMTLGWTRGCKYRTSSPRVPAWARHGLIPSSRGRAMILTEADW